MSVNKKICMITVQHSAKDDRIYFKQALTLNAAGFDVSIVHASHDGVLRDMSGNVIEEGTDHLGIDQLVVKEPQGTFSRLAKKIYKGSFYSDFITKACGTGACVFVAHEPQSILIARKSAQKTGGTYVFDSHESLHLTSPKDKFAIRKEMPVMPFFTAANSLTRDGILKLNPNAISEVIYNASPIPSQALVETETPLIIHEGSFPFNRGLKLMMEAFALLKVKVPDFQFKLVGTIKGEELIYFNRMIKENDLRENIEVTGWKAYETLSEHLKGASIGLILNTPTPNNLYAGPANKLFNYMANNICIVAVDLPETTRIIDERQCGITLLDRSPATLSKTLESLIKDRTRLTRLRQASFEAHKELSWNEEAKKLVAFYERIISTQ